MVGARRPRISDTHTAMSTHQRERFVSHHASHVDNTAMVDVQQSTADMESADNGSPRPASPVSRSTKGYCKTCDNSIGDFYNSWYRITGSYYVPALLGSYSVTLKSTGKQKAASKGTDLEGCTIQPLACPHPNCNDAPLGFTVVTTPEGKGNFRGRDFFKLSRIELRCKVAATNQYIVVEPRENAAPDLLAAEDTPSPYSSILTPKAASSGAMEVESRPPSFSQHLGYSHGLHGQPHDHHQRPQPPLHHIEVSRHSVAAPSLSVLPQPRSPVPSLVQKTPSNSLPSPSPAAESTAGDLRPHQESSREPTVNTVGSLQGPPSAAPQVQSPRKLSQPNGHQYPRSLRDVSIDAIERLQTQISQNSGALSAHTRDIRRGEEVAQQLEVTLRQEFQTQLFRQNADIQRLEESQQRLHHDVQGMRHTLEAIRHDLQAMRVEKQSRAGTSLSDRSFRGQEGAIELMAKHVAELSHKTSDVDHLKVHIEIMKGKIHRLEQGAAHAPSRAPPQPYQPLQAPVAQPAQPAQMGAPPYHSPLVLPHNDKTLQPSSEEQHRRASFPVPSSVPAPASPQMTGPASTQTSSWATVNAGTKRAYQNGVESPPEASASMPSSPKRQRLDSSIAQTPTPILQSQTSVPEPSLASQTQQSVYAPYATQDAPSDQSWRPESQRMIEHRPRGRGRDGGPASRGGRVRKSMPGHPYGTPEWERDDWQGVPDSQTSPDAYYNHVIRGGRGGVVRRGSGGGGGGTRGGYASSDRATSLGLQGVSGGMHYGFGSSQDSLYGSGKKTRTKPIRNADGVLIRKDGRPDMRSQSSAANLRKVHQRKEGDAHHSPTGFTPTNRQYATSADAHDSPSPSGYATDPAASDRHNAIMDKIFPAGLDESRKQHDYTRQAFDDDGDQSIHTRRRSHGVTTRSAAQVKGEQVESPLDQDANMNGAEDQAEEEDHQMSERRSSQYSGVQVAAQGRDMSAEQAEAEHREEDSGTQTVSQTVPETQVSDTLTSDEAEGESTPT